MIHKGRWVPADGQALFKDSSVIPSHQIWPVTVLPKKPSRQASVVLVCSGRKLTQSWVQLKLPPAFAVVGGGKTAFTCLYSRE